MADDVSRAMKELATLHLDEPVLALLRERLAEVAVQAVAAVTEEVPSYAGELQGSMGQNIEAAVQMALAGFLGLAGDGGRPDPSTPLGPQLEGAYALGRGEARSGRTMDALLAAYRVGARVAWRELGSAAGSAGVDAPTMVQFAELVFAYIDELSAASVAGHTDELTTSGRVLERNREQLGRRLVAGADDEVLLDAAEQAGWTPPRTLTAVLLPAAQVRGALAGLGPDVLVVGEDLPGQDGAGPSSSLLLVPDVEGTGRLHLRRVLRGREAVLGPPRPWTRVRASYDRAARVAAVVVPRDDHPVDSEEHLVDLVLAADPAALVDLRTEVLAPLQDVRDSTRERLEETLRSWLLHQGRRDVVAADLQVHAQTVRYRMGQLRELFGDALDDPSAVLDLVVALGPPPPRG